MSQFSEDELSPPQSMGKTKSNDSAGGVKGSALSGVGWDQEYQNSFCRLASRFDRAPTYSPVSDQESGDDEGSRQVSHTSFDQTRGRNRNRPSASGICSLQSLPTEIVQNIAVRLESDIALSTMIMTSPTLHSILHPDGTNYIWRQRFLARYDYPHVESVLEFPYAYKVRQLVLRRFDGVAIGNSLKQRSGHQLDVIKDMVLETYNPADPHGPVPLHSKNLGILSAPNPPAWLIRLMSCSLFGSEKRKHGQPHLLFDTLQVTLSHLVLSPKSPVLAKIPSSRDNYDLAKVYNFNKPSATLFEVLEEESEETSTPFLSARFPNLKSPSPTPEPEEPRYRLNMHTLLHIRNFWQRHFTEDVHGVGENTYASVVKSLSKSGMGPREWDVPLSHQMPVNTNWYGMYSCLHPWPKNRQDLEERQSCAEDWEAVDPMTLDLETSASNEDQTFWPTAFSSIPTFADLMPDASLTTKRHVTYLRGIARFHEMKPPVPVIADSAESVPKWHPFLAARVTGFVHDIPDETLVDEDAQERRIDAYDEENNEDTDRPIPGWKQIVMVIWKPTTLHLVNVLDYAEEEYGGASGTQISANINTASIWNGTVNGNNIVSASSDGSVQSATMPSVNDSNNLTATADTSTTITPPSEAEIAEQYRLRLTKRITSFTKKYNDLLTTQVSQHNEPISRSLSSHFPTSPSKSNLNPSHKPEATPLPPLFSASHIRTLEDSFSPLQFLDWDDGTIDYAYAYEGIIIPGGKIMLGRWWRIHGTEGLGPAREVGPDGIGVEVRAVPSETAAESENGISSAGNGSAKSRAKKKGKKNKTDRDVKGKTRRRSRRNQGKKRKASAMDSDADGEGPEEDEEFVDSEVEAIEEVEGEYEFVTVVNGEESRAVNGCKGLERGPFVFWAV